MSFTPVTDQEVQQVINALRAPRALPEQLTRDGQGHWQATIQLNPQIANEAREAIQLLAQPSVLLRQSGSGVYIVVYYDEAQGRTRYQHFRNTIRTTNVTELSSIINTVRDTEDKLTDCQHIAAQQNPGASSEQIENLCAPVRSGTLPEFMWRR